MTYRERASGIECYKVIAIGLIVLSHVIQTICNPVPQLPLAKSQFLNIYQASHNPTNILLGMLQICGILGNHMFLICSVCFLRESKKQNDAKIIHMVLDVWIINLCVFGILHLFHIPMERWDTIRVLFPTMFALNWYITCYILLYRLHPYLNRFLDSLAPQEHVHLMTEMFFLYYVLPVFVEGKVYFFNEMIQFVTIYVTVSFFKRYRLDLCEDRKKNRNLFCGALFFYVGLYLGWNQLGLHIQAFAWMAQHFTIPNSLFMFGVAFSSFQWFRQYKGVHPFLNRIASSSLIVYIVHENLLFRTYIRPWIEVRVFEMFCYRHCVLLVFQMALVLAIVSFGVSVIYQSLMNRRVEALSQWLLEKFCKIWNRYQTKVLAK